MSLTTEEGFWSKVSKEGPTQSHMDTPCWEWTGAKHSSRGGHYGAVSVYANKKSSHVLAHRHVWKLVNGPIPTGMWVLHKCDHKPCVRPDHLYVGTVKDNVRDALARGHWCSGDANRAATAGKRCVGANHFSKRHPELLPRGERISKLLTTERVIAMRESRSMGAHLATLAREYGVSQSTVSLICRGDTWTHVGGPVTR